MNYGGNINRWSPLKSAERGHTEEGRLIILHLKIKAKIESSYAPGDPS